MDDVNSRTSRRRRWTTDDIRSKIEKSKVVLFGRGSNEDPRCGYTNEAVTVLQDSGRPFEIVDIMDDPSAGAALRAFAGPVHPPVIFIDGEMVSSSDSLPKMVLNGELATKVKGAFKN